MRHVDNSLEAFTIRGQDATIDFIEDIPESAPNPVPPIGAAASARVRLTRGPNSLRRGQGSTAEPPTAERTTRTFA
jgi:hypothetical protein